MTTLHNTNLYHTSHKFHPINIDVLSNMHNFDEN